MDRSCKSAGGKSKNKMLTLFDDITTKDLTDHERNILVPLVIKILSNTSSKKRAFAKDISQAFLEQRREKVNQIRLCKLIAHIRRNDLVYPMTVIGSSRGYFLTNDRQIIKDQVESLRGRIVSIKSVMHALESQLLVNEARSLTQNQNNNVS